MIHDLRDPERLQNPAFSAQVRAVREPRSRNGKLDVERRPIRFATLRLIRGITRGMDPINLHLVRSINGHPPVGGPQLERQLRGTVGTGPHRLQDCESPAPNETQSRQDS